MYYKMSFMKKILSVLYAFFMMITIYAQSADVITEMLDADEATFGQVCYIAAVQMNLIDENDSLETAVKTLYEKEIIPTLVDAAAPVPAVDVAFIYSRLWKIKGGLMYRLTKGAPRYAFRQFKSDGIIDQNLDPAAIISGADALSIYTSCVNQYSGFNMRNVSMEEE